MESLEDRRMLATFTFTNDAEFDLGQFLNVNHDAPNSNQLQLDDDINGSWSIIQDAGEPDAVWTSIRFNSEPEGRIPDGAQLIVSARVADAEVNLGNQNFNNVPNGAPIAAQGQFIQVVVSFAPAGEAGESPVLSDLTLETLDPPGQMLPTDDSEDNDNQAQATIVGSPPTATINDQTLEDSEDVDFFKYTAHETGKLLVSAYNSLEAIDVVLLLDDTGSFANVGPALVGAFPTLVSNLEAALPNTSLAFGVARFEEYGGEIAGDDRPFILNQPVIETSNPDFTAAINSALNRTSPGGGGDVPETVIEALYQTATGVGFDGNGNLSTTETGAAGQVSTQVNPGFTGDVPAFSSFIPDPTGPTVAADGTIGGVGFREGALKIILVATDAGFVFEPDGIANYVGAGGVTVPAADLQVNSRNTTPGGRGAQIQQTIDALNAIDAQVIGLGTTTVATATPRRNLEALSTLTGGVNNGTTAIDVGIPGDLIEPGEPLYFPININNVNSLTDGVTAAVGAVANSIQVRIVSESGVEMAVAETAEILPGLFESELAIPVVGQEEYFIEVTSPLGDSFTYDLEIENFPVPVPTSVFLNPADDVGMMNNDNVTSNAESLEFFVHLDASDFARMGIEIDPAGVAPGLRATLAVASATSSFTVSTNLSEVNADRVWSATIPANVLPDGSYLVGASAVIFDGQDGPASPGAVGVGPQGPPLLLTIDNTAPDVSEDGGGGPPNLLDASDSGLDNQDNVTNKMEPAFDGTGEPGNKVRLFANGELVGRDVVDSEGNWEITSEPLVDNLYDITYVLEDLAGNVSEVSDPLRIEIDTLAPNLPLLDLAEESDTGRHNDDNVTRDNTPLLRFTSEDRTANPAAYSHLVAENLAYRLFDRLEETAETLLLDSFLAFGLLNSNTFNFGSAPLLDGIHNFKLEVEDRAGNISPDFLLNVLIDTAAPIPPSFDLAPDSDTGIPGQPDLSIDLITSDSAPTVNGQSEANTIVRLFADEGLPLGTAGNVFQGITVAVPLDGDEAFQPGNWSIDTEVDLNDPDFFSLGGLRELSANAEDLAGNVSAYSHLPLFVDTQGPQVEEIAIGGSPGYDIFAEKPAEQGPTPNVDSLVISFIDNPVRVAIEEREGPEEPRVFGANGSPASVPFVYPAVNYHLAAQPGNYTLVGDANGVILIESVNFVDSTMNGTLGMTTVELVFSAPLPDDRFTLTISDNLRDDAGNALDGESNTAAAGGNLDSPSGDDAVGGDFVARFTVDSRAEVGVWAAGSVYVDTNGNFQFDPENPDTSNEDITYTLGFTSDNIFAGNFVEPEAEGDADGFDKLAAYGLVGGQFRWLIDTDNDGIPNLVITEPAAVNGLPFAGNWDNNPDNGDEVGLYDGSTWYLDTDHDFQVDTQLPANGNSNLIGFPIAGDFDGDGQDDLGTWADDTFSLDLSSDGGLTGTADQVFQFGFIGVRERPFAADFDTDGIDDIGLWVPDRAGALPAGSAEWYILVSGGNSIVDRLRVNPEPGSSGQIADFRPIPFGNDIFASFGDEFSLPVPGNFDPPTVPIDAAQLQPLKFSNDNPLDVNDDQKITPIDVLMVINKLNASGPERLPYILTQASRTSAAPYLDTTEDWVVSPADALAVINEINRLTGSGEGESAVVASPTSADASLLTGTFAYDSHEAVAASSESSVDVVVDVAGPAALPLPAIGPVAAPSAATAAADEADAESLDDLLELLAQDVAEQS